MLRERMVDIGGYKLHMAEAGEGGPVVILEAGCGDGLETWSKVQEEIGSFARAISYDRAGLGKSEPGRQPRRIDIMVDELRTLLHRAEISPPYILVGHSLGGQIVRLLAARHSEEVAGIVLVDATHEDVFCTIQEYPEEWAAFRRFVESEIPTWTKVKQEEWEAAPGDCDIMRRETNWLKAPAAVLTSGSAARFLAGPSADLMQMLLNLQLGYLKHFPCATHTVTDKSGHYIQKGEPHLVIEAVRQVAEAAWASPLRGQ